MVPWITFLHNFMNIYDELAKGENPHTVMNLSLPQQDNVEGKCVKCPDPSLSFKSTLVFSYPPLFPKLDEKEYCI